MKDLTLIATLPNINDQQKIKEIMSNPNISSARFNTGVNQLMSAYETVQIISEISKFYNKDIWLDIKGRQLRITKWADPAYDAIELNHNVSIIYPAKIYFRNGSACNIIRTRGNKVLVEEPPKQAVGRGQSVNIIAKDLEIEGYLTNQDIEYLEAARQFGLNKVMASYVEKKEDLLSILAINSNATIISKVESLKGFKFIVENDVKNLMAARDDLFIETGQSIEILKILKTIIQKDKNAICASRIFSSLEHSSDISLADYSDLALMELLGYKNFMLCDNVSNYQFVKATKAWERYMNE